MEFNIGVGVGIGIGIELKNGQKGEIRKVVRLEEEKTAKTWNV
jgi:hypothetical protein